MDKAITVAIDGPAGAGKSTLARRIAHKLGFRYIDTGAMYRAVALWAVRRNVALSDMHRLEQLAEQAQIEFVAGDDRVLLNGEDVSDAIRTLEISQAASKVSAVPGVRRAMVKLQREIGSQASVVMEGRDIGSIVFPDADVKIFLDAHTEARTRSAAYANWKRLRKRCRRRCAGGIIAIGRARNRRWFRHPMRFISTPPRSRSRKPNKPS